MIAKLSLKGLKCKKCMINVKTKLEEAGAVVREISLKEVELEIHEDEKVDKFIDVIRKAGYDARLVEVSG
ncbi:MAG: hypothetical protein N3D09_04660 [Archaeoglobaceae archaeon]|nr:hypothetical protein [Archaeoglobaceae archaeon]